jgi:hypothetical protein
MAPPIPIYINATTDYRYWDNVEGDALVCSTRGPPEFQALCILNQFFFGFAFAIQGSINLYNAQRLRRLQTSVTVADPFSSMKRTSAVMPQQPGQKANLVYFTVLSGSFGIKQLAYGTCHMIGIGGTLNPPSTLEGLSGDAMLALTISFVLYVALLQLRGAEAFKIIVELRSQSQLHRTLFTRALNFAQGVGAIPITAGVWVLLASGLIRRYTYYSVVCGLICYAGARSMVENILERGRTLIRVNHLQQRAGGGIDALHRRRSILKHKLRRLIVLTLGISSCAVFVPATLVLLGSVYSSTQLLIHYSVFNTVLLIVWTHACMATHKHVSKKCNKRGKLSSVTMSRKGLPDAEVARVKSGEYTVADVSGMSMVGDSSFEVNRPSRGEGLFGDLTSDYSTDRDATKGGTAGESVNENSVRPSEARENKGECSRVLEAKGP